MNKHKFGGIIAFIVLIALFQNCGQQFASNTLNSEGVIFSSNVFCDNESCRMYELNYFYSTEDTLRPPEILTFIPNYEPNSSSQSKASNALHVISVWKEKSGGSESTFSSATYGEVYGISKEKATKLCEDHLIYTGPNSLFNGEADHFLCIHKNEILTYGPGVLNAMNNICGSECNRFLTNELSEVLLDMESFGQKTNSALTANDNFSNRRLINSNSRSMSTAEDEHDDDICTFHDKDGSSYSLKPGDSAVMIYVISAGGYNPSGGRYRHGKFCEERLMFCRSGGKASGRILKSKYIGDQDRSNCNESFFEDSDKYLYSQYREWFKVIEDSFVTCQNREPSQTDLRSSIEKLLKDQVSIDEVKESICSYQNTNQSNDSEQVDNHSNSRNIQKEQSDSSNDEPNKDQPRLGERFCERRDLNGNTVVLSSMGPGKTVFMTEAAAQNPASGRYPEGFSVFCMKQTWSCATSGRMRAWTHGAIHLPDRDRSRCNERLFEGKPEYTYSTYKNHFKTVKDVFLACKNRVPNAQEVQTGVEFLLDKKSRSDLEKIHCKYGSVIDVAVPKTNNERLVAIFYRKYLKREPDTDGLAFYSGLLDSGVAMSVVENDIKNSKEAQDKR